MIRPEGPIRVGILAPSLDIVGGQSIAATRLYQLVKLVTCGGSVGCNEFVFERISRSSGEA
jgi:hypothetical protein